MSIFETFSKMKYIVSMLTIATLAAEGQTTEVANPITFHGKATGGSLTIAEVMYCEGTYATIRTQPGEPPESVAMRLADAANLKGIALRKPAGRDVAFSAVGATLDLFASPGEFVLGGTEKGLSIPRAPAHLTAVPIPTGQGLTFHWVNGAEKYEHVYVFSSQAFFNKCAGGDTHVKTNHWVSDQVLKQRGLNKKFWAVGVAANGVPSNAGAMRIQIDRQGAFTEDELFAIPFTCGLAPNWLQWQSTPGSRLEQGVKAGHEYYGLHPELIESPDEKPFYQLVRSDTENTTGGVWRKFLGLLPGHTYALAVRLNTLEMKFTDPNWNASFHAAWTPAGADLTPAQLASEAPLPDGTSGIHAGEIVRYGPEAITNGAWVRSSTDNPGSPSQIGNITLPENVDTITIWLRCTGKIPEGVGMDWVSLEDKSLE